MQNDTSYNTLGQQNMLGAQNSNCTNTGPEENKYGIIRDSKEPPR